MRNNAFVRAGRSGNSAGGRTAAAGILALLLAIGSGGIAEAQERPEETKSNQQVATQPAPKRVVNQVSLKRAYLGRAPWICIPSGFGKTASCSPRGGAG